MCRRNTNLSHSFIWPMNKQKPIIYPNFLTFPIYQWRSFYLKKVNMLLVFSCISEIANLLNLIFFNILRIWINLEKIPRGVSVNESWRTSQIPRELWRRYLLSVLISVMGKVLWDCRFCLGVCLKTIVLSTYGFCCVITWNIHKYW